MRQDRECLGCAHSVSIERRTALSTWPSRTDEYLIAGVAASDVDRWVQTASVLHGEWRCVRLRGV